MGAYWDQGHPGPRAILLVARVARPLGLARPGRCPCSALCSVLHAGLTWVRVCTRRLVSRWNSVRNVFRGLHLIVNPTERQACSTCVLPPHDRHSTLLPKVHGRNNSGVLAPSGTRCGPHDRRSHWRHVPSVIHRGDDKAMLQKQTNTLIKPYARSRGQSVR